MHWRRFVQDWGDSIFANLRGRHLLLSTLELQELLVLLHHLKGGSIGGSGWDRGLHEWLRSKRGMSAGLRHS